LRLAAFRYEEIKKSIVDFFEEQKICCTPINGFEIATKIGAKIIPYSMFPEKELLEKVSKDGFSIKKGSQWYLYYNDAQSYERINFTMMHETGHIILDHTEESEVAEAEANFFAKFSLAPPVLIHKFDLRDPYEVADRFEISLEAAFYAFNYYKKWLKYGEKAYKDYELKICEMFGLAF